MKPAIIEVLSQVEASPTTSSQIIPNDLTNDRRKIQGWEPIPANYGGSLILIGFDTEYQNLDGQNKVLSYQYYACDPTGAIAWSGIYYPPENGRRVKLPWFIERVITEGKLQGKLSRWPKRAYLIGHFNLADLTAFDDFEQLKTEFDAIRRTYATITQDTAIICWDVDRHKHKITLVLRDSMLLAPAGMQTLKAIGDLVGVQKLELNPGEIENMQALLTEHPHRFEDYALRDPKIAVHYCRKIMAINDELTGKQEIPPTLSSIGINHLLNTWETNGIDKNLVLGTEDSVKQEWSPKLRHFIKRRITVPTAYRAIHENVATECYHGGRNEQYFFGASEIGDWTDFDLCGAYTTAMALVGIGMFTERAYCRFLCPLGGVLALLDRLACLNKEDVQRGPCAADPHHLPRGYCVAQVHSHRGVTARPSSIYR